MDYEKKYKETIAWIDIIMPTLTKEQQEDALENFPELAESEDERIRKDIMVLVKDWWDRVNKDNISTKEQMLAWLERQGGNNNQNWKPSKGQINALEHFVRSIGESGYASPYDDNTKLLNSLINDLYKLEKQGEQKPTDKVVPKFKVGDWIVDNHGIVNQVTSTTDDGYGLALYDGTYVSGCWKDYYHLWTIQDAKDGDVLVVERDKTPFIFKEFDKFHPGCPVAYCSIDDSGIFVNSDDGWWTDEKVYPATKEQRDTLFAKMEEAGYEWDAEKKELKKIEEDGVENKKQIMSEMVDLVTAYVKQKSEPAWSEEDEFRFNCTVGYLNRMNDANGGIFLEDIDWLKSLKDRVSWKPSKKQMETLEYYMHALLATEHKEVLFGLYNDLKKL